MRTEPDDDAAVLRAVAAGDERALGVLVARHTPWLRVRLLRRYADAEVVDDVLQDTFVAVWRGAAGWRGDGEVAAWLWSIAVRRLVSRLRHRKAPTPVGADQLDTPLASAEDLVLQSVAHGDVGQALLALSPELRVVLQATVLDGLSTREAARLLRLPVGTVKSRASRAREALRRSLVTPPTTDPRGA